MFTNEIAELPALTYDRPLLPPRLEHFLVPPLSKAERARRAARVVRNLTFAVAVVVVILATTLPGTSP
jgi:hypothetical protein